MLKIGLTGGIGCGKTAAADHFARLGAQVIDTDLLSRELVTPGQPALTEIVEVFGNGVLTGAGELDRKRLRELIFADSKARKRLEGILHPKIRRTMLERADNSKAPYVIFVIPLLLETGQQSLVDRVLVIDLPEELQRQRVANRDDLNDEQISQILAAQIDRQTRLQAADDVVNNNGGITQLHHQIENLHQKYLSQSQD